MDKASQVLMEDACSGANRSFRARSRHSNVPRTTFSIGHVDAESEARALTMTYHKLPLLHCQRVRSLRSTISSRTMPARWT